MSSFKQVKAVDADGDAVVYRLTRPPGPFVVVPQTGEIILTENPQVHGALWYKKCYRRFDFQCYGSVQIFPDPDPTFQVHYDLDPALKPRHVNVPLPGWTAKLLWRASDLYQLSQSVHAYPQLLFLMNKVYVPVTALPKSLLPVLSWCSK
jgi:hypothetical protein